MYRIIQKRNYLFALSIILLIPGMLAFGVWGLRLGIDFTGGSQLNYAIPGNVTLDQVLETVQKLNFGDVQVQTSSDNSFFIKLPYLTNEQHDEVQSAISSTFPGSLEQSFETIGPSVGNELKQKAMFALAAVLVAIIIFITWAFRRVSTGPVPSWFYGVSAFLALIHDVLMVVGVFAVLGHYYHVNVDSLFVTALLTVLGFSIHDTIVVFDRIRERLRLSSSRSFEDVVNESLNQTIVRSLNTSLTTIIVLIALFLFGGGSIRYFILALIIGIVSGTYSSIFVASPILVVYERFRRR